MHNFKELKVWQESMRLAKVLLLVTSSFPPDEKFGLVSQMRRAGVSIPSNIAEGAGRSSDKEFARFLDIAIGSGYELETQAILALDFEYMPKEDAEELIQLITTIQRMLNGLRNTMIKN
jgi:four helix bundle protein